MFQKVEFELERAGFVRNDVGGETAWRDVERRLPAVIHPGRERELHLANDLSPELESRTGGTPRRVWNVRPGR
ncbi:hypothetical protein D3C83_69320 [compost metagenome]